MSAVPSPTSRASWFLPATRSIPEEIRVLSRHLLRDESANRLLDAIPGLAMILDEHGQIVAVNERARDALSGHDVAELVGAADIDSSSGMIVHPEFAPIGLRPGEALDCIRWVDGPRGCGTSPHCGECGAALSITAAQEGNRTSRECRISTQDGALEFDVVATPFDFHGRRLVVLALRDVSDEKRRRVLERFFFHDVLNTAGGLEGLCQLLFGPEGELLDEADRSDLRDLMVSASASLVREIRAQQQLMAAEAGELKADPEVVQLMNFLHDVAGLARSHEVATERRIRVAGEDCAISTDPVILQRVVLNLLKNALEASEPGQVVTLSSTLSPDGVVVAVHNEAVMSESVRLQVFQRSFSTKAQHGRGLGTYSVKLLTENVLGGRVDFTSQDGVGTTFFVHLPVDWIDSD